MFYCVLDDVRYNIARLRMKKRDALKGSEDSQRPDRLQLQPNVRTGRRVALLPMDNVFVSRESVCSDVSDDASNGGELSRRQSENITLPGLNSEDMAALMYTVKGAFQDFDSKSLGDKEAEEPWPGQTLPGLDREQTASLMKKHGGRSLSDTDEDRTEPPEANILPGLTQAEMTSLLQKHASESIEENEETSSVLSSITE